MSALKVRTVGNAKQGHDLQTPRDTRPQSGRYLISSPRKLDAETELAMSMADALEDILNSER